MRYWQDWLKSWNEDEAIRAITVNGHCYDSQKLSYLIVNFSFYLFINMSFIANATITHGFKKFFSENT